jgi:hypothetical protein
MKVDNLDIKMEDRIEAWFNHSMAVQGMMCGCGHLHGTDRFFLV